MSTQNKITQEEAKTQNRRKKIAFLRGCSELQFMCSESSCLPDSHLLGSLCVALFRQERRKPSTALEVQSGQDREEEGKRRRSLI